MQGVYFFPENMSLNFYFSQRLLKIAQRRFSYFPEAHKKLHLVFFKTN
jgi:hypothetical protein